MNAILAIHPYKHQGLWVFDDPNAGLVQERFVSGADKIIERMVERISGAQSGFTLLFSAAPSLVINRCSNGVGATWAGTGTTVGTWESKAACVPRSSNTSSAPDRIYAQFKPKAA
jgi:hypothetical protein